MCLCSGSPIPWRCELQEGGDIVCSGIPSALKCLACSWHLVIVPVARPPGTPQDPDFSMKPGPPARHWLWEARSLPRSILLSRVARVSFMQNHCTYSAEDTVEVRTSARNSASPRPHSLAWGWVLQWDSRIATYLAVWFWGKWHNLSETSLVFLSAKLVY